MRKPIFLVITFIFLNHISIAQNVDYVNESHFLKRVDYNVISKVTPYGPDVINDTLNIELSDSVYISRQLEEIIGEEINDDIEDIEVASISVYNTIEEAEAAMVAMMAGEKIHYNELKNNKKDTLEKALSQDKEISILDGMVILEMNMGGDFPCIGIHLSDKNINMGMGTYLEIKRQEDFFLVKVKYEPERYSTIDGAIEEYLKELFLSFYEERDNEYGKKVWAAFVTEGGLQLFIDTAKDYIDEEFLDSPFNEIYG